MLTHRQIFQQHLAQTSELPLQLEIERAEGVYMYDVNGNAYLDLISGISVSNVGHRHPEVIQAIKDQLDKYLHLMVYGEYIQSPQVLYAALITKNLPEKLNCVYFVNSGSEATEAALKLAKRYSGRSEIISFNNAYHGSTNGALSVLGDENMKNSFRPLLPDIRFIEFNDRNNLNYITKKTAAVIIEPIQAEAGVILPVKGYLEDLRKKCDETETLLIFDEVQTGFGRTGTLFAFEQYNVCPDILVIAKGMGGGMPLGALISDKGIMNSFKTNPVLGHITTFGGHPVSCAAALACLKIILREKLPQEALRKEKLFRKLLKHDAIFEIRGKGLLLAVQLKIPENNSKLMKIALEKGIVTGDYLFSNKCFSINPPLTISDDEIKIACRKIIESIDAL